MCLYHVIHPIYILRTPSSPQFFLSRQDIIILGAGSFTADSLLENFTQVRKEINADSDPQELTCEMLGSIYPETVPICPLYLLKPLLSTDISNWDQILFTQICYPVQLPHTA